MYTKTTTLLLFACLIGAQLIAQKVNYEIISNEPNKFNRTRISIYPYSLEAYMGEDIAFALKLETQVSIFVPQVKYSRPYFEMFDKGPKSRTTLEIGTCINFSEKNAKEDVHVTLSSEQYTNGNKIITEENFVNVPAEVKNISSLYVGFFNWNVPAIIEHGNVPGRANGLNPFYNYQTADGSINVPIYDWAGYNGTEVQPAGIKGPPSVMEKLTGLKLGLHLRKITNLTVNLNNWGVRKIKNVSDFSFDFIYAFNIKMDGFTDNAGVKWVYAPTSKKLTRHLGWQLSYAKQWKVFGWYWDFGWKPAKKVMRKGVLSIMDNGVNLDAGISFVLGVNKSFMVKE